jgi:glucose-1-phosphate thymidylyltransferase
MKGIILAWGSWTRLYPITMAISKQLMPIYDKPMIYYPLTTLMLAGIREILIITTPHDKAAFERLLGDGSAWWLSLVYKVQDAPEWLPQAFVLAEDFLDGDSACLILWDNLFYGQWFSRLLQETKRKVEETGNSYIFWYAVSDPERSWVVEFDAEMNVLSIEEKPKTPKSNYAIPGLYFYTGDAPKIARGLKKSERWEYEIVDMHLAYLRESRLKVELFNRGYAWLDTGTHASMIDAANFIKIVQDRQWLQVGSPEEVAYRMWWIDANQVRSLAEPMKKNGYGQYLLNLIK